MNDVFNIHFFRKSTLEKLDYQKLIDFLQEMPYFTVYYTADNTVEIEYSDDEFGLKYRYIITEKSRVSKIYKLDPMYSNVNLLLEMPLVIPSFLAKEIFLVTQKICRIFELGYYHDDFDDVKAFDLVDLSVFFENKRSLYLEENGMKNKIKYDKDKFNVICKFQRSVDDLVHYYHNKVTVNLCYPVIDKKSGDSGIAYDWRIGDPVIFAPYVDYINVLDIEEGNIIVYKKELLDIIKKRCSEIKNYLPDMTIVKDKYAKQCKKDMKKIKKIALLGKDFQILTLKDVIEE